MRNYQLSRLTLLGDIIASLSHDERFVAAWLAGSFGRDEADARSDLDLNVVVSAQDAEVLCTRPWQVGAGTTAERLELISGFGKPAIIHENHNNAPNGGTFTFVVYSESAVM